MRNTQSYGYLCQIIWLGNLLLDLYMGILDS